MSGCVNRVVLLGTIGKYGISMRFAPSGSACASFSLVLTEQSPDGKYFSTLVPCEVWGKKAEASSDLEPGQLCLFEGKLAKRRKGEGAWEMVVSGFDVTPITPAAVLAGSGGEHEH
jgi:primosomal replication protein N